VVASHVKIISPAKPLDQHHIMKTLKTIQGRCFEEKRINMYLRFQREPDSFENYNATLADSSLQSWTKSPYKSSICK
jgi:hypothetical protein